MMSFHQRSYQSRFSALGDTAEQVFDELNPKHHKLGVNRPPFSLAGMNPNWRYTPDRMVRSGLVEVMAIGHDDTLKIKHEKIDALTAWAKLGDVDLFVYHQPKNAYCQAPFRDWVRALRKHGVADEFDDGKTFMALHLDHFPSQLEAVPVGDDAPGHPVN